MFIFMIHCNRRNRDTSTVKAMSTYEKQPVDRQTDRRIDNGALVIAYRSFGYGTLKSIFVPIINLFSLMIELVP